MEFLKLNNGIEMAYAPLGQGNRSEMYSEPAVAALAEKYNKTARR